MDDFKWMILAFAAVGIVVTLSENFGSKAKTPEVPACTSCHTGSVKPPKWDVHGIYKKLGGG